MDERAGGSASPQKILVTGGTGFVGAYTLLELLRRGYEVKALRRQSKLPPFIPPAALERVHWIEGDILDPLALEEAFSGVDAVVHSAAMISMSAKDKAAMLRTNVDGTANVVNACLETGVRRLLYVSSVSALGRHEEGATMSEGDPWDPVRPTTNYGQSKYLAEMEVWRGVGEGLSATVVNPSTVIGYGNWNTGSCAIFKSVYTRFPWYTNGINGFVGVEDLATAIANLLEKGAVAERYIISAENWSFRKLFDAIADGFSRPKPGWEATPFLGALAWRVEKLKSLFTGKTPVLTRESASIAQSAVYYDNRKILETLPGFHFTDIHTVIRRACAQYIEQEKPSR